ncbi:ASCH domain-containing protein [Streptococcus saliviloxodontae]|uniref:ASC-1-like (ASCH) protein n=1 Tax=Streptococcus saliviloxodontae TaxID=1349416 RepID=A0ABS2PN77_9STRE|nr:ASCH domain-containing protein [Streptococcus saliviloxodontae]MBM7636888.1 ASC-1-like (ASCH) protein [Streptococcus saliviloxodontae]
MIHEMLLAPEPFEKIKSGQKTIELRLYDDRRQAITIGDQICFYRLGDEVQLNTEVVALHIFDDFTQLYEKLNLLKCGYTKSDIELAKPEDMEAYYALEQIKKYKVVGIELKVLDELTRSAI